MRHSTSSSPLTLLAGAVALLTLAACGGGGTETAQPAGSASSKAERSVVVDQKLAKQVPSAISSDGKITVGTDATYAPNEFLAPDGQTVVGFDVDLFRAVAAKLGLRTTFVPAPFSAIIPGVSSGKYEIGVSSFSINADREKQTDMISYFNAGTQWAAPTGNPDGIDPDNACGKKIAVQRGTVQADDVTSRSKDCTDNGDPAIQVDQYQGQDQATSAVVSGKDQAMLADSPVIAYAISQTGGRLEKVGELYDAALYGYVVKKGDTAFSDALAGAVNALIADGTYQRILGRWKVDDGAVAKAQVDPPAAE
ncbi:ABC transporter substrate-binding protein [Nocardioides iriomotensis]|uniref:ABC transporter substrate-binding protein n=1 Tax=Nocardioides iriomotensis TaxID=715784 RepID=A0A4Q5J2P9_9ACTN|nr:ABC transporter substrate-binding protein [Nocardioides iriomotensis]RYU12704.1 ABC transporter substrate-binding protein [Nocardioides iriomotensis]